MKKAIFCILSMFFVLIPGAFGPAAHAASERVVLQRETGEFFPPERGVAELSAVRNGEIYFQDIRIRVVGAGEKTEIRPAEDGGYDPFLQIVSFNGESDQIFYGADSGGSGGFGFYFAYDAQGKELFSSQKFAVPYTAAYADGFRVRVENTETGDTVYLDLSGRDESYLSQIYNADGTLIKPLSCDVSGANAVSPFYFSEGRYGLEIYARVTGLYNADVVGWIIMRTSLEGGAFEPFFSVVGAYGG